MTECYDWVSWLSVMTECNDLIHDDLLQCLLWEHKIKTWYEDMITMLLCWDIALSHYIQSLHSIIALSHCIESLHSVIPLGHCTRSLHSVIALDYCTRSLHLVIALGHCTRSLHSVIAFSHCTQSLLSVIALDVHTQQQQRMLNSIEESKTKVSESKLIQVRFLRQLSCIWKGVVGERGMRSKKEEYEKSQKG
jgi:hypothetical protein